MKITDEELDNAMSRFRQQLNRRRVNRFIRPQAPVIESKSVTIYDDDVVNFQKRKRKILNKIFNG